jgi:hypothetical protein
MNSPPIRSACSACKSSKPPTARTCRRIPSGPGNGRWKSIFETNIRPRCRRKGRLSAGRTVRTAFSCGPCSRWRGRRKPIPSVMMESGRPAPPPAHLPMAGMPAGRSSCAVRGSGGVDAPAAWTLRRIPGEFLSPPVDDRRQSGQPATEKASTLASVGTVDADRGSSRSGSPAVFRFRKNPDRIGSPGIGYENHGTRFPATSRRRFLPERGMKGDWRRR